MPNDTCTYWLAGIVAGQTILACLCLAAGFSAFAGANGIQVVLGSLLLQQAHQDFYQACVPAALYSAICFIGFACEATSSLGPAVYIVGSRQYHVLAGGASPGLPSAWYLAPVLSPVLSFAGAVVSLLFLALNGPMEQLGHGERRPLLAKEDLAPALWPGLTPCLLHCGTCGAATGACKCLSRGADSSQTSPFKAVLAMPAETRSPPPTPPMEHMEPERASGPPPAPKPKSRGPSDPSALKLGP